MCLNNASRILDLNLRAGILFVDEEKSGSSDHQNDAVCQMVLPYEEEDSAESPFLSYPSASCTCFYLAVAIDVEFQEMEHEVVRLKI